MIDLVCGPLTVHFFTIVVKVSAVDRVYPNARDRFMAEFGATSFNRALFGLAVMGRETVEVRLELLNDIGIVPGVDVAVACMGQGPLLNCPGVIFRCEGEQFDDRWTVDIWEAPAIRGAVTQEGPTKPIQRCPQHSPFTLQSAPETPWQLWRHHAAHAGLVSSSGGGEDEAGLEDEPVVRRQSAVQRVQAAHAATERVEPVDGYTPEGHYDVLAAGLADILMRTGADVDEEMLALLSMYNRRLRIVLGLPVPVAH